jgi:hypothetical protein
MNKTNKICGSLFFIGMIGCAIISTNYSGTKSSQSRILSHISLAPEAALAVDDSDCDYVLYVCLRSGGNASQCRQDYNECREYTADPR